MASSSESSAEAATALRIAHELEEDGDAAAARRCVEHAIDCAREAAAGALRLDEALLLSAAEPPAEFIASVGLATLGALAREAEELDEARSALEESTSIWPRNATALHRLADLELHHGCFARACELYESAASLPPIVARRDEWHDILVASPRTHAVAHSSYTLALLRHLPRTGVEATK